MPLKYKISDAINMFIDSDANNPLVEIEFKFVRYQLILDDPVKAAQLATLIREILSKKPQPKGEEMRMPKFYSKR
jgi:hypothetical protein